MSMCISEEELFLNRMISKINDQQSGPVVSKETLDNFKNSTLFTELVSSLESEVKSGRLDMKNWHHQL